MKYQASPRCPRIVIFSCAGAPYSAETLSHLLRMDPTLLDSIVGVVLSRPRLGASAGETLRNAAGGGLAVSDLAREALTAFSYRGNRLKERLSRLVHGAAENLGLRATGNWQRIEEFCDSRGIPPHYTRAPGSDETLEVLRGLEPDMVIMMTFHHILKAPVLAIPQIGVFNVHPSLLPAFRGPDPINDALRSGATETGATIHWVDMGVDTGDIICQAPVPIPPGSVENTLRPAIAEAAARLIVQLVRYAREDSIPRKPQPRQGQSGPAGVSARSSFPG